MPYLKKRRVLICGASGFIGRNLFEELSKKKGLDVYGTYHTNKFSKNPKLIKADLTNKNQVSGITKGFDVLIQAAAVTSGAKDIITRPYIHITNNLIMNSMLLQAAYDHSIPQVIFLSCTVMYQPNTGKPVKETDLDLNVPMYTSYFGGGWMKVYVEKLCEFYSRLKRSKFTVIRHSNIYGPYDKYDLDKSHVFGATITKVLTAKDGDKINVWGKGEEERDLLYVSDLVSFIELVLKKQDYDYDVFNLGLGKSISIANLVKKIIAISGKRLNIFYDISKPTIPTKLSINISKSRKKFHWAPKIGIDEGINKTIRWYMENIL
ncbi:NAD-dependent epimerase/dehydratase family protein [Candidatus Daviesbacteria bacterium]|nr:NAD-dependent epimerase/dehydratase family protein [Candidatus Daviesbacteria bacterium]